MKKVVKFGGSSLASAQQFRKVGDIVRAEEDRKYVIPSAPGKRFNGDTKVTDMLYDCYQSAEEGEDFKGKLKNIKARYEEIITGLGLELSLDSEFKTIEENFKKHVGESFSEYRNRFRLLRATELIKKGNRKIIYIALDVGYENVTYFNRLFYREYHMTPHDYREQFKQN